MAKMLAFYALAAVLQVSNCMNLPAIITAKYDMLIFTQAWPMTSCYEWEEKSPSHKCNLPPDEEWSIHGLWPTKNGTMGPFFCNRTMHFNLAALESLRAQLEVKWIDVHKGAKPHEFWRHEWEKHGTCSVDLEVVNTEKKYFQKGLDLLDQYDMKHVLGKANIVPNGKYHLQDYLDGVRKILGKNAQVECVRNTKRKELYISEMRICFDRQFDLIDCNGIPHFPSNCDHNQQIIYPGSVPDLITHLQPSAIQI
ncbi:ribonuclease Oy [Nasonia vitripennis]|uniref:Uncharacterized protein n=1 Tax=Nasonia vitripennis TaxID=7425 RepID=A0A7M7G1M1_NASVI|nr:ribonuclease Oy [Nasonia vitripennis]